MRLAALFLLITALPLRAVVSEDTLPNQTQWISASGEGRTGGVAFFRRTFEIGSSLVKAVLFAAAERSAEIHVNGPRVAEVSGFTNALTLDLTSFIRTGTNVIAARVTSGSGQAAFRLMLELAFADGKQRWVVSDASWLSSRTEMPDWKELEFRPDGWILAFAQGRAGLAKWGNPFQPVKSPDAYNSWMLARNANGATDPETITRLPGFKVELLRSAKPEEDSWIALAFDPKGRLTIAREKRGLLRMTLGSDRVAGVEVIEDTLLECRGLLYAYDSLYVNANNSKGFYRLRDTDGDGKFDESKLLLSTDGGVGHGRNHVVLGPDGLIYLVHGDDVVLPPNIATNSPLQQMTDDQLMPARDSPTRRSVRRFEQLGHVLQTDRDGSFFGLIAGGLRNPLGVAFNDAGEMFTYDADMERDISAPWYLPTRVLQLVAGGDYGWRRSRPNLPPYALDTLPAALDIGVGSPTGIDFGTASQFPEKYRRALFIADWAYGRILAVHLRPDGASYRGAAETFLSGRPLNVTDFVFGPDGAMYFITGGRGTMSGLYRVSSREPAEKRPPLASGSEVDRHGADFHAIRRKLENLCSSKASKASSANEALEEIWPQLANPDRWVRYAARIALEHQPMELWFDRAFAATNPRIAVVALLALGRLSGQDVQDRLISRLEELLQAGLDESEQLAVLRVLSMRLARFGRPNDEIVSTLVQKLGRFYPSASRPVNYELCRLLTFLHAPDVIAKTSTLLGRTHTTEDLLHYTLHLAPLQRGWTMEQRRVFFEALRRAEQEQGGSDYYSAIKAVRKEAAAQLTTEQFEELADMLAPVQAVPVTLGSLNHTLPFIRDWKLEDFAFSSAAHRSSADAGRQAFRAAGCVQCHRFDNEGGVFGPDLTFIGARFSRHDLLDTILNPSKAIDEKYRTTIVTLTTGEQISGVLEREDEVTLVLRGGATGDVGSDIQKAGIAARRLSDMSPMPTGLLNGLTAEQVYDVLEFLERGTAKPVSGSSTLQTE